MLKLLETINANANETTVVIMLIIAILSIAMLKDSILPFNAPPATSEITIQKFAAIAITTQFEAVLNKCQYAIRLSP